MDGHGVKSACIEPLFERPGDIRFDSKGAEPFRVLVISPRADSNIPYPYPHAHGSRSPARGVTAEIYRRWMTRGVVQGASVDRPQFQIGSRRYSVDTGFVGGRKLRRVRGGRAYIDGWRRGEQ